MFSNASDNSRRTMAAMVVAIVVATVAIMNKSDQWTGNSTDNDKGIDISNNAGTSNSY